jgi:Putative type VII ESX secretion system translocon, EccE
MAAINPDPARGALHMRQRVIALVAAVAFLLAATAPGAVGLAAVGIVLAVLALPQWRGRALVSWLGTAVRYAARGRHSFGQSGIFPLIAPDAIVTPIEVSGIPVGAIADVHGLTAVVEIGDPDAVLASGGVIVPMPADLVGSPTPDEPATSIQVLVVRRGHFQRLFVAVRVGGDGIGWTDAQLRQALSSAVRGVVRRLARVGVTGRPLTAATAPAAIAWSVDGGPDVAGREIEERWDHLRTGDGVQVTVRIGNTAGRLSADLLGRLLRGSATVSALAVAEDRLLLRLAAATPAALASAVASVMAACPGSVSHLDGEQHRGLTETLPLGFTEPTMATRPGAKPRPRRAPSTERFASPTRPIGSGADPHQHAGPTTLPDAGLLLGRDRRGVPVLLQLDPNRTTPLRLAVVGGPVAARVLSGRLRALTDGSGAAATVPVAMAAFDHLTPADSATLASADVVVCQPISQPEAALVATALRLTRAGAWLSRIDGDMIAIIGNGAVRWAQLSAPAVDARRSAGLAGLAGLART